MRWALLAAFLVAGCVRAVPASAQADDPSLLTALFLDARSMEPRLANDFACAGVENAGTEEDASETVLASLRERMGVPVLPQSLCRRDERTSLVVAKGVGGNGTWLTVGDIACERPDRCKATVSYYVANQGAGGREVTAEQTADGWRVEQTGSFWVS